jgi:hypothetical protein
MADVATRAAHRRTVAGLPVAAEAMTQSSPTPAGASAACKAGFAARGTGARSLVADG